MTQTELELETITAARVARYTAWAASAPRPSLLARIGQYLDAASCLECGEEGWTTVAAHLDHRCED